MARELGCRCEWVKAARGAAARAQEANAKKSSGPDATVYMLAASLGVCTPCARARAAVNQAWKRRSVSQREVRRP